MADTRQLLERSAGADDGPPRMTRARKAEATRRNLIDAAARVVGAEGYANASVAKITALAEIAQGTFYNYFSSQQDLFDQLLPELGASLLDFIRERVAPETDSFKREEIGFRAFFEFVRQRPEFYRILNEAETFSPKAFEAHMHNMADGYLRALRKSAAKGEIADFQDRDLEIIVYTLLAARNYLWFRYMRDDHRSGPLPDWVVQAYMRLLESGIRPVRAARSTQRARNAAPAALPTQSARVRINTKTQTIAFTVSERDLDAKGTVVRTALLELFEASGRHLSQPATSDAEAPELISLNATFLRPTTAARLIASGTIQTIGEHVSTAIAIHESGRDGTAPVATAQALYRLTAAPAVPAVATKPGRRERRKR